jgi:uncharacterized protein
MTRPVLRFAAPAVLALTLALAGALPGGATAAGSSEPVWSSTYIGTPDGESLLVDVLHPADLPPAAGPRPVLLVVSPYLGDEAGLDWTKRFDDFYRGAYGGEGLFANGWSVVQVHLRGTSGSSGCLDILGPGEQTDIAAGVAWVDDQPWADGIAMYGKSYDANTGAAALAMRPAGLDAVVAQAIGPDRYRATHNDRVRLAQSLLYPSATYGVPAEGNFTTGSDTRYVANSASRSADCQALLAEHYLDDERLPFWQVRDFPERAKGSQVPAFITAGYLDNATNIGGGALDLFNALEGPKHLWIGWWAHDRGNDKTGDRFNVGRSTWFAETTAFLEHHVKGTPLDELPDYPRYTVAAQSGDGSWRYEDALPAADTGTVEVGLRCGVYTDDGSGRGSADPGLGAGGLVRTGSLTDGVWTFGEPVRERTHIAGVPQAVLSVRPLLPRSNVVVNLYDVDPQGRATMISRGAGLVDVLGEEVVRLWPTDWVLQPGHRLGVRVSDANTDNYVHVPSGGQVQVLSGVVELPVLPAGPRTSAPGTSTPRLETYRQRAPFDVSALLR